MSLYAVVDPATGETVQEYPTATDQQIEEALASAAKAYRESVSYTHLTLPTILRV